MSRLVIGSKWYVVSYPARRSTIANTVCKRKATAGRGAGACVHCTVNLIKLLIGITVLLTVQCTVSCLHY
jgi:hypothetical protein